MNSARRFRFRSTLWATALLGGLVVTGCGPEPMSTMEVAPESAPAGATANQVMQNDRTEAVAQASVAQAPEVPRSQPQLVKTAELTIAVDSVEKSIDAATAIARQQQGDVLNLEDQTPLDSGDRYTASMQLRIPQGSLDATLEALAKLGTVQRQAISAEDVSTQLVDFQARLRNLRRTEDMLLDIMKRSGSVGDVLKVAQELSNIRSSIEQIDAQLKNLQNRVAYSTITLRLEGAIAPDGASQPPISRQLGETWGVASQSIGEFTVNLMQLGIWLLVYSPYWLLVGAAIYGYRRWRRQSARLPIVVESEPPTSNS
jgi:hypothetical protein